MRYPAREQAPEIFANAVKIREQMKIKPLREDGKSIMLSGKIDRGYIVQPGVKITLNKGSTFEGIVIDSSKTFWNQGQYVSQQFKLNSSGKIE